MTCAFCTEHEMPNKDDINNLNIVQLPENPRVMKFSRDAFVSLDTRDHPEADRVYIFGINVVTRVLGENWFLSSVDPCSFRELEITDRVGAYFGRHIYQLRTVDPDMMALAIVGRNEDGTRSVLQFDSLFLEPSQKTL